MANRCATTSQIETLSGNVAASIFDTNWNNPVTALNDASLGYVNAIATDTGSANNYVVLPPFGVPTAYNAGMPVTFLPANTNTGASTITVTPLTSQSILDFAGNPVVAGAIQAGIRTDLVYISGAFRLPYKSIPQIIYSNNVVTGGAQTTTINCLSSPFVTICYDATGGTSNATYTINVTNVLAGCHFNVQIYPFGSAQIFKWTGTDNAGNTISDIKANYPQGSSLSVQVDLIGNGDGATTRLVYNGAYTRNTAGAGSSHIHFISAFH